MFGRRPLNSVAKDDRDRFVGFAFAAAETLVELDKEHRVVDVMGVGVTGPSHQAKGHPFVELLREEDRIVAGAALAAAARGGRIAPTRLLFAAGPHGPRAAILSGWCLPDLGGRYFLALREPTGTHADPGESTDEETGLLEIDAFKSAVAGVSAGEQPSTMTLLDVEGLTEASRALTAEDSRSLMKRIGGALKGFAMGGALAGRTSGDTFGVVHDPGVDVSGLTETLRQAVSRAAPAGKGLVVRNASVKLDGGAISPDEAAEAVLYAIRKFGETRGGASVLGSLSENCAALVTESVDRLARLKRVVAEGDFTLEIQAVANVANRSTWFFQALPRYPDDLGPSESVAEYAQQVGLAEDLALKTLDKSIAALDSLRAKVGKGLSISVTLPLASLASTEHFAGMEVRLRKVAHLRSKLVLEFAGRVPGDKAAAVNDAVQGLRRAGHVVCLSDFGVGSSSFDNLRTIEVNAVRVGIHTVARAVSNPRRRAFLKALASFCHDLGVEMIGDGVDDARTSEFLAACGVHFGQGTAFGPRRPIEGVLQSLKRKATNLVSETRRVLSPEAG